LLNDNGGSNRWRS